VDFKGPQKRMRRFAARQDKLLDQIDEDASEQREYS